MLLTPPRERNTISVASGRKQLLAEGIGERAVACPAKPDLLDQLRQMLRSRHYDIRTAQELVGHKDVEATMSYTPFLLSSCASLLLLATGCSRDPLLGTWSVTDINGTVEAITRVPNRLGSEVILEAFRTQFKERYSGKHIEFTNEEPHSFLVPVAFEGSVRGCIHGAWMRDSENKEAVNVYQWVSGSVYHLWGHATLKNGKMQIVIVTYGDPGPVLRFRKAR